MIIVFFPDYGGMVNPKTWNLTGWLDHAYVNWFEKVTPLFCIDRNHSWDLRKSKIFPMQYLKPEYLKRLENR